MGTGKWYLDYLTFIIFGVLLIVFFVTGIIKWKRFVYWFEDDELRIEYGLFVKKKRYIPFDRIQSLDYTEGILHRPLKLVKVKVETAGNTASLKSEAELTAITKEAAAQIEAEMAEAKRRKVIVVADDGELMEDAEEEVGHSFKTGLCDVYEGLDYLGDNVRRDWPDFVGGIDLSLSVQ